MSSTSTTRKRIFAKMPHRTATTTGNKSALMQSFREVLDELGNEHDQGVSNHRSQHDNKKQCFQPKDDPLGDEMTRILNTRTEFKRSLSLGGFMEDGDLEFLDSHPTLQPLISSRNWRWICRTVRAVAMILLSRKDVLRDVPDATKKFQKFLFWNTKSELGGLLTLVALCFMFSAGGAIAVTFATMWTVRFTCLLSMTVLALLIDLKEVSQMLPPAFHAFLDGFISGATRFDRTFLYGRRFRGREWGKSDFDYVDGKHAPSFGMYLWDLPPPLTTDETTNARRNQRIDWSEDTTRHVESIDYCVTMLREGFAREKDRQQRRFLFQRNKTNSMEPERDEKKDEFPEDYDFARSTSSPAAIHLKDTNNRKIDTIVDSSERPPDRWHRVNPSFDDGIFAEDDISCRSDGSAKHSCLSGRSAESDTDLNWIDVGAEIGKKLLGSAAVQKAMTSHDTAERIVTMRENFEEKMGAKRMEQAAREQNGSRGDASAKDKGATSVLPPVHSMWTSASAAAQDASGLSPTLTVTSSGSLEPMSRQVQIIEHIEPEETQPSQKPFALSPRWMLRTDPAATSTLSDLQLPSIPPSELCDSKENYPTEITTLSCPSFEVVRESSRPPITPLEARKPNRRAPLMAGVKIAVPMFPYQPGSRSTRMFHRGNYQMATVVSSKRIAIFQKNALPPPGKRRSNCLSIKVHLDKSFMRQGKFAVMSIRVMDDWADRYMPKHSKFPIGSCVATSFGVGVLVGWRVEDDCHVVRSLWQRRGPGSACAYLQRDAIHSTTGAATGFEVETKLGKGEVVGYTHGGKDFRGGRFLVEITGPGNHQNQTLALAKSDIVSCKSARFIPVVEHVREAVQYQLQVDRYNDSIEEDQPDPFEPIKGKHWRKVSSYSDILWKSFLRATDEDDGFDEGMNEFVASLVRFFETLDAQPGSVDANGNDISKIVITATDSSQRKEDTAEPSLWLMNDFFGLFGGKGHEQQRDGDESIEIEVGEADMLNNAANKKNYDRAFGVIRTLMRTVSIARAGCSDEPEFKLALSICYEFLIFVKTVVKVQQKNMSPRSLKIWKRALEEIVSTFGPVKERLERIGRGIADRMEKQGRRAKVRVLRFVDIIVQDDILLMAMEQGDWARCGVQIEEALVKSKIIDEENREHYHRTAHYIYRHFADISAKNSNAVARNNEKLERIGAIIQCFAAPRKFLLRLLVEDVVLDTLERVLVRVFDDEEVAFQMLSIHASNFHSLRQFRMLKDFTIAGKFWMPLLDAADAEFSFLVSKMPDAAKEYMVPLSSLFSLCVLQFHKISEGDLTKDWLDFLLEEEAVNIIHDIDVKLILALESFSRDVKEMMVVLPYYPSIEEDILNLVDEVDIDEFLKEASDAVEDPEKLSEFIKEKATIAIERFLDYLPKMSIPVEKRDLADGWVLTCRGADGGDLKLTDLSIKKENLTCQVAGGKTLFFPMLGSEEPDCVCDVSVTESKVVDSDAAASKFDDAESSVLDHIRILLLNARHHGCWQEGIGGVHQPPTDRYVASVLQGLPVSSVLNCGIDLWRNLEIDDDELIEIAVRDVSYQIQLQAERDALEEEKETKDDHNPVIHRQPLLTRNSDVSDRHLQHRFNPRVDPSVLYLEIQNLTFNLHKFLFRIEKHEDRRTIFDPVFEGSGSLMVQNVSIKLRVECVKDYVKHMGRKRAVPLLQINELDVQLEKVQLSVKDTGADWLLNKVVKSFEGNITHILATNLNEQVRAQLQLALENLNGYSAVNPNVILGILDISLDDLEEKVAWV